MKKNKSFAASYDRRDNVYRFSYIFSVHCRVHFSNWALSYDVNKIYRIPLKTKINNSSCSLKNIRNIKNWYALLAGHKKLQNFFLLNIFLNLTIYEKNVD